MLKTKKIALFHFFQQRLCTQHKLNRKNNCHHEFSKTDKKKEKHTETKVVAVKKSLA